MVERYPTDLSHFTIQAGDIGCLQTLSCIPVMAGDSIELQLEGAWRLSPLRRQLVVDCKIDIFGFYVPFRHIYDAEWVDFIKAGPAEAETFTGVALANTNAYLGAPAYNGETIPLWRPASYNRIWNRYFRSPTDDGSRLKADNAVFTDRRAISGENCGPLPVPWSTGVKEGVDPTLREVDTSGDVFDIVDLKRIQQTYRRAVDEEYFGQRYNDLLGVLFGSRVNIDADERPLLVEHSSFWLSGVDVNGTGDGNLGQYAGKAAGIGRFGFRRKFFPEHGSLWIMCLPRFPTIHVYERPYLLTVTNPTYLEIGGDSELISAEPPREYDSSEFFYGGGANALGTMPYGQHYRYHPSLVHPAFQAVDGFSFNDTAPTTMDQAWYVQAADYDECFSSTTLNHWQCQLAISCNAMRTVPPARRSLYAGA